MQQTKYLIKLKSPGSSRLQQYISGALLATELAITLQLLQLPSLSASLTVALWCIAVSMPGFAFDFLLDVYTNERGYVLEIFPRARYETFYVAFVLLAVVSVAAVIHHFIPVAAYAFGTVSAFAFYRMRKYVSALEEEVEGAAESAEAQPSAGKSGA
jgi:hypothetical protein